MMTACRKCIFHTWMIHITTHDTIKNIMCPSMMNSLLVIYDEYMSSNISHMDDSCHNTRHDRVCIMCSSIMDSLLVMYDEYMSSHISHVDESCHNTRHDRVYNVLMYDEFTFSDF